MCMCICMHAHVWYDMYLLFPLQVDLEFSALYFEFEYEDYFDFQLFPESESNRFVCSVSVSDNGISSPRFVRFLCLSAVAQFLSLSLIMTLISLFRANFVYVLCLSIVALCLSLSLIMALISFSGQILFSFLVLHVIIVDSDIALSEHVCYRYHYHTISYYHTDINIILILLSY